MFCALSHTVTVQKFAETRRDYRGEMAGAALVLAFCTTTLAKENRTPWLEYHQYDYIDKDWGTANEDIQDAYFVKHRITPPASVTVVIDATADANRITTDTEALLRRRVKPMEIWIIVSEQHKGARDAVNAIAARAIADSVKVQWISLPAEFDATLFDYMSLHARTRYVALFTKRPLTRPLPELHELIRAIESKSLLLTYNGDICPQTNTTMYYYRLCNERPTNQPSSNGLPTQLPPERADIPSWAEAFEAQIGESDERNVKDRGHGTVEWRFIKREHLFYALAKDIPNDTMPALVDRAASYGDVQNCMVCRYGSGACGLVVPKSNKRRRSDAVEVQRFEYYPEARQIAFESPVLLVSETRQHHRRCLEIYSDAAKVCIPAFRGGESWFASRLRLMSALIEALCHWGPRELLESNDLDADDGKVVSDMWALYSTNPSCSQARSKYELF